MTQLVKYAGYDAMARPPIPHEEMVRRGEVAAANRRKHALRLFRQGADTLQVAKHMNIKEHVALAWITEERNREYAEKHA
jgi:hypothetical protein